RRKEVAEVVRRLFGRRAVHKAANVVAEAVLAPAETPLTAHPIVRVTQVEKRKLELFRVDLRTRDRGARYFQDLGVVRLQARVASRQLRHLRAAEHTGHSLGEPDDYVLPAAEIVQSDLRALRGW